MTSINLVYYEMDKYLPINSLYISDIRKQRKENSVLTLYVLTDINSLSSDAALKWCSANTEVFLLNCFLRLRMVV